VLKQVNEKPLSPQNKHWNTIS